MQSTLIAAAERLLLKFWPMLEPILLVALANIARRVIQTARDGSFPAQWKFLEPAFDSCADDLLRTINETFPS